MLLNTNYVGTENYIMIFIFFEGLRRFILILNRDIILNKEICTNLRIYLNFV